MLKIMVSLLVVSLFVGCSFTKQTTVTYEKYKSSKEVKALHVQERKTTKEVDFSKIKNKKIVNKNNLSIDGTIKGYITNLKQIKSMWHYRVKGVDLSNYKLPLAEFTHTSKLAKEGDLVYVIIKKGKLKELFLIKKGNYKKKKNIKKYQKNKLKTYKRTKKRQVLGVPTSEEIRLD